MAILKIMTTENRLITWLMIIPALLLLVMLSEANGLTNVTSQPYPELDRTDTVQGIDANQNGIRDDIERFIGSLDITQEQKEKLFDYSRYVQKVMVKDAFTLTNTREFDQAMGASMLCALYTFEDRSEGRTYIRQIMKFSANTYDRAKNYDSYNAMMNGKAIPMPSVKTCYSASN